MPVPPVGAPTGAVVGRPTRPCDSFHKTDDGHVQEEAGQLVATTGPGAHVTPAGAPFAVLLRGALWPSLLAGAVAVVVLWLTRGTDGLLGGSLGVLVAGAFFASGLAAMSRLVRDASPLVVVPAALAVYLGQTIALLLVIVLLGDAAWLDGTAFGVAVLVVALAWQLFQVLAFVRARRPVFDEPADASTATVLDR
ncbi:MAG TPA: hypothetical protein VES95_07400 [Dermatophilaceae bacterium]|nr:hypothetical protein [Dermatophilaceae bacterium]